VSASDAALVAAAAVETGAAASLEAAAEAVVVPEVADPAEPQELSSRATPTDAIATGVSRR
jgi:hypothetical protein